LLANYFTLRTLVREWQETLSGSTIEQVYSQSKGELTIVVSLSETEIHSIRIATRAPFQFVFEYSGQNRARRNTRSIFPRVVGSRIISILIADADRQITMVLSNDRTIRIDFMGSRSNVYLVGADGTVSDRFREVGTEIGVRPPQPRSAQIPDSVPDLRSRMDVFSGLPAVRLKRAVSLFDRTLAEEVVFLAGGKNTDEPDSDKLFGSMLSVIESFEQASPRVYARGDMVTGIAAIELRSKSEEDVKLFPTMNEAVVYFVRRVLSQSGFESLFKPLIAAVESRLTRTSRRYERMAEELSKPSRADTYEKFGHLLMANQSAVGAGTDVVELDDIICRSGVVSVKLDPLLGAIQNAERYYQRARKIRQSRDTSKERVENARAEVDRLTKLKEKIDGLTSRDEVVRFKKEYADDLAWLSSSGAAGGSEVPFRQFDIGGGYIVWVGRNATQNDELTLHAARKYDYWLHARGVAGSHVILRIPAKNVKPPRRIVEKAAAIAAYYSKARTSSYVPVIFTEKKFVRKPRKSPAGSVLVEREEVIMIEPGIPSV